MLITHIYPHLNLNQRCQKVKNMGGGGAVPIGGDNLPSLVEIGLPDLPNIGGASSGITVNLTPPHQHLLLKHGKSSLQLNLGVRNTHDYF